MSVVGATAMACIGPVLLLLIRSLFNTTLRIKPGMYWHFIPAVLLPLALPLSDWKILSPAYYTITLHVFVYLFITWGAVFRSRESFKADDLKWKWALSLLAGVTFLSITFAFQVTIYQPVFYAANVIVAALLFYGLSLWAIKRSRLFLPESSGKTENAQVLEELGKRIQHLLETEVVFTDSHLTVSSLASKLNAQPYLVSKAVNHFFQKSFSELLIHYRIKKAELLLLSPNSKMYTIEGIAFESGFNTLSAFYAAFKKIHKTTPAQFRETKGSTNMKVA
jgi:AraC-like DNA-binding protein